MKARWKSCFGIQKLKLFNSFKMKKIIFISVVSIVIVACFPNTYLPKPNEINNFTKGMWMECQLSDRSRIKGELLALNDMQIYIMPLSGEVQTVERQNIKSVVLNVSLTTNNPEKLRGGPFIPLLALSHGWFLIFTLPINILIVAPTMQAQRRGAYIVEYPKSVTWEQMAKFSRFPQGVPNGIDIYSLKENIAQK